MQKINLRELYPDIYKKDTYLEVTDEVQAVFLADKRAEARYLPLRRLLCSTRRPRKKSWRTSRPSGFMPGST